MSSEPYERPLTDGEELANSLSHAVGFLLAVFIGIPVLVATAWRHHDSWEVIGGAIFGASLALLYGASRALPHAASRPGEALLPPS